MDNICNNFINGTAWSKNILQIIQDYMRGNWDALRYWALHYWPYVEVLEPKMLRDRFFEVIKGIQERYSVGK